MPFPEINALVQTLRQMKNGGAFVKYIDYIRFPFFRSLEPDTRIEFNFPITVFVGKNGGGKSSTLQALFGCPEGKSLGNYWFSTDLDPIVDPITGDRHCFIYSYRIPKEGPREVLKTRIHKPSNPDYWEPSRPISRYGMTKLPKGKRNRAIAMDVLHIDFRGILSAFDKYFYFHSPRTQSKQEYLRHKSKTLKRVIEQDLSLIHRGKKINEKPVWLTKQELTDLSRVLGKSYQKVGLVTHKFFSTWGTSVILKTDHQAYSEAFAGSGETAAAILIHELAMASDHTLVLLDEPEVSLHPGAQKQLIRYILEKAKQKKLQIIISTHSPSIVEHLPQESIKLFQEQKNGKVTVVSDVTANEAFFSLGHDVPNKSNIIVEDELAKILVNAVIEQKGEVYASQFNVAYGTGGATNIRRNIVFYSNEAAISRFVLFDGDQKPASAIPDPGTIAIGNRNPAGLKPHISQCTGGQDISFYPDAGATGVNEESLVKMMLSYLAFFHKHVDFLPFQSPEEVLWDEPAARKFLSDFGIGSQQIDEIVSASDAKKRFEKMSSIFDAKSGEEIKMIHKMFLRKWITKKDSNYVALEQIIDRIRSQHEQARSQGKLSGR